MPNSPPYYPEAFRAEAVALVQSGDRSIPQIARDLGDNEHTLRN
jgi:transposase-like protein